MNLLESVSLLCSIIQCTLTVRNCLCIHVIYEMYSIWNYAIVQRLSTCEHCIFIIENSQFWREARYAVLNFSTLFFNFAENDKYPYCHQPIILYPILYKICYSMKRYSFIVHVYILEDSKTFFLFISFSGNRPLDKPGCVIKKCFSYSSSKYI